MIKFSEITLETLTRRLQLVQANALNERTSAHYT